MSAVCWLIPSINRLFNKFDLERWPLHCRALQMNAGYTLPTHGQSFFITSPTFAQLLMLYGRRAVLSFDKSLSKDEQLYEFCLHRNVLRTQLYQEPIKDLLSGGGSVQFPLHSRWSAAPPEVLAVLMSQVLEAWSLRPFCSPPLSLHLVFLSVPANFDSILPPPYARHLLW